MTQLFLQHTHYVTASHVTSLESVQIVNWNPHLISVCKDVFLTYPVHADNLNCAILQYTACHLA